MLCFYYIEKNILKIISESLIDDQNVKTYIFTKEDDLVGFFELLEHTKKKEIEIAYFGLLKEYQNYFNNIKNHLLLL